DDPARREKGTDYEIPIFARRLYRYYLEITKMMENTPENGDLSISVSIHEFKEDIEWPNPGNRWACLRKVEPRNFKEYFEGSVLDKDSGQIVGKLTICRISDDLRRATIVVHKVEGVENPGYDIPESEDATVAPPENVRPKDWQAKYNVGPEKAWERAFKEVGWKLGFEFNTPALYSRSPVKNGTWTTGELQ